jgi:hypothetical protein
MRACRACEKEARQLSRALVVGLAPPAGCHEPGLVCGRCAARGVLLVPVSQPPVIKRVETRSDDVDAALRQLRALRRVCDDDRRAEGLDQAIQVLTGNRG